MCEQLKLLEIFQGLFQRNLELGLSRFDPSDIVSHPILLPLASGKKRYLLYPLRVIDHFFPMTTRRLLCVSPVIVPTAISHFGNALICADKCTDDDYETEIQWLADAALKSSVYGGGRRFWTHPFASHGASYRGNDHSGIESCAHHTSRMGLFLIHAGNYLNNNDCIDAGTQAVESLLSEHHWTHGEGDTWTMSYYPSTKDQVINTSAEAAALFSLVNSKELEAQLSSRILGITKMVLDEQLECGGWNYETRKHSTTHNSPPTKPDNHHNAMVISSLANVVNHPANHSIQTLIEDALVRGVNFHLHSLCPSSTPPLMTMNSNRMADIAGYAESICMICNCGKLQIFRDNKYQSTFKNAITNLLKHWQKNLFLPNTNDVACNKRFGKKYNIRSLRWGSGPAMEAVAMSMSFYKDQLTI